MKISDQFNRKGRLILRPSADRETEGKEIIDSNKHVSDKAWHLFQSGVSDITDMNLGAALGNLPWTRCPSESSTMKTDALVKSESIGT